MEFGFLFCIIIFTQIGEVGILTWKNNWAETSWKIFPFQSYQKIMVPSSRLLFLPKVWYLLFCESKFFGYQKSKDLCYHVCLESTVRGYHRESLIYEVSRKRCAIDEDYQNQ